MTAMETIIAVAMLSASVVGALVALATLAVVARSSRKEAGGEP